MPQTLTVQIPQGIETKKQLFDILKAGLRFPGSFGNNWDAFDECINDLSWLDETTIVLAHAEFPSLPDQDFVDYCDILKNAIEEWQSLGTKRFVVVFG